MTADIGHLRSFMIAAVAVLLILGSGCGTSGLGSESPLMLFVASRSTRHLIRVDPAAGTSAVVSALPAEALSLHLDVKASVLYAGTSAGLVTLQLPSLQQSLVTTAPGAVIALSAADGKLLVSDRSTNRFFVFDPQTRAVAEFSGTALAADFSSDGRFAFVAGGDALFPYSTSGLSAAISVPSGAWDVQFVPDSAVAYVAGQVMQARAACDGSILASIPQPATILTLTPDGSHLISLWVANVSTWSDTSLVLSGSCPPSVTQQTISADVEEAGLGTIQPLKLIALGRHKRAYVLYFANPAGPVASQLGVPSFDFGGRVTGRVKLTGAPHSVLDAAVNADETRIYFATNGENAIHIIDSASQLEIAKITLGVLDPGAGPDFVVAWPN